jgi:adenylate cyclase
MTKAFRVLQEIERKFLVASDAWRRGADQGRRFRQAYLAETDRAVVRVRIEDDARGFLTVKSAKAGLSRAEIECPLKLTEAETLIELRQGSVLRKTRFHTAHAGRIWEVDVYCGENAGLVTAEIELASEEETVELPPWLGQEVTGTARYYAARLARHPYASWSEAERRQSG